MITELGYIGALLIGLVLGLTGGGGSIMTVPVLVYVMGLNPVVATAYSLFIVGTTSAFGTIQNIKKEVVDIKTGLRFAIPSLISVYLTRRFIVPAIPEILFQNTNFTLSKSTFLMVLFAVVMFAAALSMLKKKSFRVNPKDKNPKLVFTILKIAIVGVLIGLIGAGGGFLIIPALVFMAKLPMRKAIATSLLIISINSLIGFTGDIGHFIIDWPFLLSFSAFAVIGIYIGIYLSKFIPENQLKKGFGWFVLIMAIFIFIKELFF
jgi:uncharacterized membrane protein YfcA